MTTRQPIDPNPEKWAQAMGPRARRDVGVFMKYINLDDQTRSRWPSGRPRNLADRALHQLVIGSQGKDLTYVHESTMGAGMVGVLMRIFAAGGIVAAQPGSFWTG